MTQQPSHQPPWLGFSIDRAGDVPVFEQICQALRARIIAGDLAEGVRLPATRVFATELGLSRSTIVTAYEQLVAEGYLRSRQGSGYRICALGEVELAQAAPAPSMPPERSSELEEKRGGEGVATWTSPPLPTPRPFAASQPDMRMFPHRTWAKAVARVCRTTPEALLSRSAPFGNPDLRTAIADHVAQWRGISARPEQILITAGSTDALEICLRALTQPGQAIALEDPGYLPLRHLVRAHGLQLRLLEVGGDGESGAMLPAPNDDTRLAVLTPSHQYPLGGAMSPNRRLDYLAWARTQDGWIIEDDYDSEFRYAGRPIPALAGFDGLQRTIYIGSFSKVFSNALRLGYLIAPEPLLPRLDQVLGQFGQHASSMPQQPLAEFMRSGEFYRHLRRVRRTYGERRKFLLQRLRSEFADFGHVVDHQAGMQLVFHLSDRFDDAEICRRAGQRGVTVQPLSGFATDPGGSPRRNGLILGFCACSQQEMAPALDLLAACFTG